MYQNVSDEASNTEQTHRDMALNFARSKVEKPPYGWDQKTCVEEICGMDIEPERLAHGFCRCYDCQSRREANFKRK